MLEFMKFGEFSSSDTSSVTGSAGVRSTLANSVNKDSLSLRSIGGEFVSTSSEAVEVLENILSVY